MHQTPRRDGCPHRTSDRGVARSGPLSVVPQLTHPYCSRNSPAGDGAGVRACSVTVTVPNQARSSRAPLLDGRSVECLGVAEGDVAMDIGAHLPLMDFGGHPFTLEHLVEYTKTAEQLGFSAVSVNDHMVFSVPWLDCPNALAAVTEHSGA